MRQISPRVKKLLLKDSRMEKCEWCGKATEEWHPVLIYAGRQIDEAFAISGVCKKCHEMVTSHKSKSKEEERTVEHMRAYFKLNAINRMSKEDRIKYHKAVPPWIHQKEQLTKKLYEYSRKS